MMCEHPKTICEGHDGSFECTPFCATCEGDGEYCQECKGYNEAIAFVMDVISVMKSHFDVYTLSELEKRIA